MTLTFSKKKNEEEEENEIEIEDLNMIVKLRRECSDYLTRNHPKIIQDLDVNKDKAIREMKKALLLFLESKKIEQHIINYTIENFDKYILKYGDLDDLLQIEEVSDVRVVSKDCVRVKVNGDRVTTNIKFDTDNEVISLARLIARKNKGDYANVNALLKLSDIDTYDDFRLRINISNEYVNSIKTPYIHLRKIPKDKRTMDQLESLNMMSREENIYLKQVFDCGLSMLVVGKGGSGKTSLVNAGIEEIPHNKSGLVVQESEELFSDTHPDMQFQRVVYNNGDSKIKYGLKELAINGLLTDLDVFMIGEIKGAEARDFINACYTGHISYTTVHGSSSIDGIYKLVDYVKYGSDYSREEVLSMLKEIDVITFMKDFKIQEITEIAGFNHETNKILFNKVFEKNQRINDSCKKINDKKADSRNSQRIKTENREKALKCLKGFV